MYLSTNVYLPTDMNTTSNQWSYLHKNIFFVIILISRHKLFRLIQKYISPMINNCLLCCMNWYASGVIRKTYCIHTQFASYLYGSKILQPYIAATVGIRSDALLSSTRALMIETIMKNDCQKQIVQFRFGRIRWPDTCESALTSSPHAMLTDGMVL